MPSTEVINKAAKLLRGNMVIFSAVGHRYDVGIGDNAYTVHVGQDRDGDAYYTCTCKFGREHGVINNIDKVCHHIAAAATLDAKLVRAANQRRQGG